MATSDTAWRAVAAVPERQRAGLDGLGLGRADHAVGHEGCLRVAGLAPADLFDDLPLGPVPWHESIIILTARARGSR